MYVGIGPEKGKVIYSEEFAFAYAMDRCFSSEEEMKELLANFLLEEVNPDIDWLNKFREEVVEWYYSGNWVKENMQIK